LESCPDTDIENGTSVRTTDGADISVFAYALLANSKVKIIENIDFLITVYSYL
jgi:hypothetical protein